MSIRRLAASASIAAASTRRVELVEAFAHGVGGVHHHRLRELADIVAEDPVGCEIDRRHRQRRRELDLELAERSDEPTERQKRVTVGWLTPARRGELGDGQARRRLEVLAHRLRRRGAPPGCSSLSTRWIRETMSIAERRRCCSSIRRRAMLSASSCQTAVLRQS